MLNIHNLPTSLRSAMSAREVNAVDLAKYSGVHRTLIGRILAGKPAQSDTLAKLDSALAALPVKQAAA